MFFFVCTSFKGFYSQQVEGLRVEACWTPLLAISNDLARLWIHVIALMEGPGVARGWKWKTVATLALIAVGFYELNSQRLTLIFSVFSWPHIITFPFFFFSDSHCSYLECPFVPFCLYKVYLAFIISQDESWRVIEFYDRKGTKPSSSKAPRGC